MSLYILYFICVQVIICDLCIYFGLEVCVCCFCDVVLKFVLKMKLAECFYFGNI